MAKSKKTLQELTKFRQQLLDKLSSSDFKWKPVKLLGGVTIEVCEVVRVDGYYLPVTAQETFNIAKRHGYYPLTRAVADQIMNNATFQQYLWQPELPDFEQYTDYLKDKSYDGISKFGAHKLWVISKRRGVNKTKAINYGFYELRANQAKGTLERGGSNLDKTYNPKQGLGGAHFDNHWDYSQLLQLMKTDAPITVDGKQYSIGMALREGKPAFSDEGEYAQDDLP